MHDFTSLDLIVLVVYLLGVTVWGAWLGRGQKGGVDYFLGSRSLPWWAVMLSVVATETSTLTFLSVPGVAYMGTMTFLQLTIGYLFGRLVVAAVLLPAYYRGELTTAYHLLQARFGLGARRFTSAIFMVTRVLSDSVRLFATAIPLAIITGWPYWESILVIGVLTLVYTYFGGIKAVVWIDSLQMVLYLGGAVAALVALQIGVSGGWGAILSSAGAAGKLHTFDFSFDRMQPYTFWAAVLGGGFISMSSHGVDQIIVQRLLTTKDLRSSQKALVGSAFAIIVQFTLFLGVGLGLWVFYQGRTFERSDEIFARFIVEQLPPGITGLLIAGVFAAAMSTLSGSINSLASASAFDYWAPLVGAGETHGDEADARVLRAGKVFSLIWAVMLVGAAVLFIPLSKGTSAVEVALGIASLVYGGLLGAFFLGVLTRRPGQWAAIIGVGVGIGLTTLLRNEMAWPWYALFGSVVTFVTGLVVTAVWPGSRQPGA
jgi:SSS family solute:Na+ symporter